MLRALFAALAALADWLRDRQGIMAGRAVQANEAVKEAARRVEQAEAVDRAADPVRDKRLRSRFDAAARGGE
jgi:hypothetical protein